MNSIDIKYQMFISSTWEDLKEERSLVIETVLKHYQFPIGMEMFNADNEAQWKVIRKTIDTSDLYILIIGHRYGSLTKAKNPISYTEKEFNYARKRTMPILAFIRDRHQAIDPAKIDSANESRLVEFIKKVKNCGITVDYWTTGDDLGKKVSFAISKMVDKFERDQDFADSGWIKKSSMNNLALSATQASILENSLAINKFLEDSADKFEVINETIEKHVFDEKGNCIVERKRTQICNSDVTHTFMKYEADKEGESRIIDIIESTDFKVPKKLPYIICYQDAKMINFCILFGRVINSGERVKYETKVHIPNYLSNLIDNGIGYIEYKGLKNSKYANREDIFIFPNRKKFENLAVKLIHVYPDQIKNEEIAPVTYGNTKTYHIKHGTINDVYNIKIEFKLN